MFKQVCKVAIVATMMATGSAAMSQDVEVNIPFSGKEYKSNEQYLRVTQSGQSQSQSVAKKIALQNARQLMAQNLESAVQAATSNYTTQLLGSPSITSTKVEQKLDDGSTLKVQTTSNSAFAQLFKDISLVFTNQTLKSTNVMEEKATLNSSTNMYTYYVVLEISKSKVDTAVVRGIQAFDNQQAQQPQQPQQGTDTQVPTQLQIDKAEFLKIFHEEMDKIENQ